MDVEEKARRFAMLRTESRNPLRKLRLGLYLAFGASGAVGFFVSFFRVLAGRELSTSLTNLAVQTAVIALMVVLWRWETRRERGDYERNLARENRRQGL